MSITRKRLSRNSTGKDGAGGAGRGKVSTMRIHVQNSSHGLGQVTPELWARVAARLGEDAYGHVVSFGAQPADFHAAIGEAEALVTDKDVLAPLLPFNAPHLKLIFVANAGLDNLAPFDWLPPASSCSTIAARTRGRRVSSASWRS